VRANPEGMCPTGAEPFIASAESSDRMVRVCERWWGARERRFDGLASLEVKADLPPLKRDHTDRNFDARYSSALDLPALFAMPRPIIGHIS